MIVAKAPPYQEAVLVIVVLVYLFHTWLDLRQRRALRKTTVPAGLKDHFTAEEFSKAQAYQLDKWWLGAWSKLFEVALSVGLLVGWYLPWAWRQSMRMAALVGLDSKNEILVTIIFALLDSAKDLVLGMPWSVYSTFVVERRHGFNKQTPWLFVKDQLKGVALGVVLLPPFVAAMTFILQYTKPVMAIYLWLFVLAVQLFFMTIYPIAIQPLFNKFTPLPDGSLRHKIEELAVSLSFPLRKLLVVDGSTRSSHSNAYMYGLGQNKRIVLFDTLIDQASQPQVVAVLAHELGHWKLGHTIRNLVLMQVTLLSQLGLFVTIRTAPGLFESFGFLEQRPVWICFVLFQLIITPVDEVVSFLTNLLSRRYEYQADAFAAKLGYSEELKGGLKVLDKHNKAPPNVDSLYSTCHHSHPTLSERLAAIDLLDQSRPSQKKAQ